MRDNVRSIVGHREKKSGSNSGQPYFMIMKEFPLQRINLIFSGGLQRCIPYSHIHQFEFYPKDTTLGADDPDVIFIESPLYGRVEVNGNNLLPLYEALMAEIVVSIREANVGESPSGDDLFVAEIGHVLYHDWKVSLEEIEGSRERVLGRRMYPHLKPGDAPPNAETPAE